MRYVMLLVLALAAVLAGCQPKAQVNVAVPPQPPPPELQPAGQLARIEPLDSVEPPARTQPVKAEPVKAEPSRLKSKAGAAQPAGESAGATYHVVTKDDTLWSLARQYLGDPKRWQEIVDANPGLSPSQLKVGQKIKIPKK